MPSPIRPATERAAATTRAFLASLAVAALLVVAAACGGDRDDVRSAGNDAPAASPSAATAPGASSGGANAAQGGGCRMAGAWQRCSAIESVERAGYRLELLRDSVSQPGLDVAGAAYRLGSAELQLFVFADSAAAARGAEAVDADDAEPAATRGILRAPAVIRSNNLVALLFDNNDRLRERVGLALAAGLPPA